MTTAVDELKTVLTRDQRDWTAPWASDGHGTLVGRGADLDRIGAFIAGVPRVGGPLLLMGEPGAGKTALLAAGGRQAKASGICVRPRRIGPRHRMWALTMWSPRPAGEDWAIGRFAAAPHRHDTGQEAPVHAAWHR
jgi:hypothetical protein